MMRLQNKNMEKAFGSFVLCPLEILVFGMHFLMSLFLYHVNTFHIAMVISLQKLIHKHRV